MLLTDPAVLTNFQHELCRHSATLELELCGLMQLCRDLDAARENAECERTMDETFCAEDMLADFIGKLRDQLYSAGVVGPVRRAA
jgi:hypothetical protein